MTLLVTKRPGPCRGGCGTYFTTGQTVWFLKRIGCFCSEECLMTDVDGWLMALDERIEAAKLVTDDARVLLRVKDPTDGEALQALDAVFEALEASLWWRRRKRHWDEIRRKKARSAQ